LLRQIPRRQPRPAQHLLDALRWQIAIAHELCLEARRRQPARSQPIPHARRLDPATGAALALGPRDGRAPAVLAVPDLSHGVSPPPIPWLAATYRPGARPSPTPAACSRDG